MKLWAVVAVLIVVLAGSGVYFSDKTTDDDTAIVLARVNTEGSGIYAYDASEYVTIVSGVVTLTDDNKAKWGGKVFATPGESSIQHLILKDLATMAGKNFALDTSTGHSLDTVYYKVVNINEMKSKFQLGEFDGGIAWEPVYSDVLSGHPEYNVCKTNQIPGYDDHSCCVISANSVFLNENPEIAIRFLAAYVKAVNFINGAIASGGTDYTELERVARLLVPAASPATLDAAMHDVTYTYSLTGFSDDYVELINKYIDTGFIMPATMERTGKTPTEFANSHINDYYLGRAVSLAGTTPTYSDVVTVKVAYLAADIHQLALKVASEEGYFAQFGIALDSSMTPLTAGGYVLDAVIAGNADFGFAGAPPTVLKSVNTAGA